MPPAGGRDGDRDAAEPFRRYADRLIALARVRLSSLLAPRFDPEDVVQFEAAWEAGGEHDPPAGGPKVVGSPFAYVPLPPHYARPETSGLGVEVAAGANARGLALTAK